jgi:predicted phosphohydrolase
MRIWAIGDLHLGSSVNKPMDIFGPAWLDHSATIQRNWRERVAPEDTVLVAGDISWGLRLAEALPDLELVGALPGTKILVKGNHDPWWSSRAKVEAVLPPGMFLLQNDARMIGEGTGVTGTRGWNLPGAPGFDPKHDGRILDREVGRLERGLEALERLDPARRLVMLHFPPVWRDNLDTPFSRRLTDAGVEVCIYGHLHGDDLALAYEGTHGGVAYRLVSCDHIGFGPVEVNP